LYLHRSQPVPILGIPLEAEQNMKYCHGSCERHLRISCVCEVATKKHLRLYFLFLCSDYDDVEEILR
jgi:hypothetical protein